ncbi:MAG: phosphatidylserine/phosphatidylglycerophosphate/cardiolipin synthase family protein [Planctomycetota bacterium]
MTLRAPAVAVVLLLAACARPCGPCPPCGPATPAAADAAVAADAADLERALDAILADDAGAPAAVDRATTLVERRLADGRLRPALDVLAARFRARHPAAANRVTDAGRVTAFAGAQLWLRGRHPTLPSVAAPTWAALADAHAAFLASSAVPRAARSLADPTFVAELEAAGGAPFLDGNDVEVLVDGPASWAVREPLLAGATGDLWIASWALYDDRTGREAVDTLLARAAAGARVTFVVDGQTASLPPYDDEVTRLETEALRRGLPVTVTRWRDAARPFDGMHWKLLIAGDAFLVGGMNFGDAYSHKDRAPGRGWRDTDVVVRGPAVAEARRSFAARFRGAPSSSRHVAPGGDAAPSADARPAGERVAVVVHAPGDDDPVLKSLLKAIDGATRTVDLEHAYVVRVPSVEAALVAAVRRGVRVRVLTNSLESCDEPVVAQAIVRSVGPLADAGVEVWLRRGSTLHSKFAAIDGVFAQVGSYNLHPRSLRLEHEVVVNVLGPRTAARLHAAFEADLGAATRVRSSADLPPLEDPLARLAWWLCRDLL